MIDPNRQHFLSACFQNLFARRPVFWSRAPGRVDLMGSHTDYNLGSVMTMTIDRDTVLAASPRPDRRVELFSLNLESGDAFDLDDIQPSLETPWSNYVRGVARYLGEAGFPLRGFSALIHSSVPFGSGLSSSAALEMAAGVIFQAAGGFQVDPVELARIGQRAENLFVGVASGILDQYSSAMGQEGCAILLDCKNLAGRPVPLAPGLAVVICDTRAPRSLAGSEYGERRALCESGASFLRQHDPAVTALCDVSADLFYAHEHELPQLTARRCRFIIEENQRVLALARALPVGDRAALHTLMADSYAGARDLFEIGAPAMQSMMDAMTSAPGCIGARQAGAGFGGCMVALVEESQVEPFASAAVRSYTAQTGIEPAVYTVRPVRGACQF